MNTLFKGQAGSNIQSILSEYFDDNHAVLYKQSEKNNNITPFHIMCKFGNIDLLKISIRWLKEAPKDSSGKTALEYGKSNKYPSRTVK